MSQNETNQVKVDLSKAEDVICGCGCKTFQPVMMIKRLSPIVSPTGEEVMVPLQVYACIECHEIPEKFKQEIADIA